jgi:hypothetical protein
MAIGDPRSAGMRSGRGKPDTALLIADDEGLAVLVPTPIGASQFIGGSSGPGTEALGVGAECVAQLARTNTHTAATATTVLSLIAHPRHPGHPLPGVDVVSFCT